MRVIPSPVLRRIMRLLVVVGVAGPAVAAASPGAAFGRYWHAGLAEISSYSVSTERYGEIRRAQAVMVFVFEELDDKTRVKVETESTPTQRRVPVLKLNHVLKFNTGFYDYSLMTSVFAGLSGPGVTRPFEPRKISFSSQEWCGNVFHQVIPRREGLRSEIRSYFESEGDADHTVPYPPGTVVYEDELPILLRELDGDWLQAGEARSVEFLPSLWDLRKQHLPLAFSRATIKKERKENRTVAGRDWEVWKWTVRKRDRVTAYYIETAHPRKLLAWDDGRGESGALIASLRSAYWREQSKESESLRKELGLSFGVGGR